MDTSQLLYWVNWLEVFGGGVSNDHDSRGIVLKGNISLDISQNHSQPVLLEHTDIGMRISSDSKLGGTLMFMSSESISS